MVPFRSTSFGHERVAREALDNGMARFGDDELVTVVDVRLREIGHRRGFGEASQHVERRQGARRVLDADRFDGNLAAQRLEDLQLPLEDPLVGAEHLLLVLLQRRCREPFAAGNRLFAVVVVRHVVQVGLRDFDVIAEHTVEADLERSDAGARALALFHRGDDLAPGAADRHEVVQFRIHAVTREAAVPREGGRLFDERAIDEVTDVGEVVELRQQAAEQRRLDGREHHLHTRRCGQRLLQRHQVTRAGGAERRARHEALEIVHRLQRLAELATVRRAEREVLDGVQAVADAFERAERPQQPRAQHAAAHRGDRAIDLVQQRSPGAAVAARDHLEVLQRDRIDDQAVGARSVGDAAHVREVRLLRVAEVGDQTAGCLDGGDAAVESEAFEAVGPELIEQRAPRRLGLEAPRGRRRHGQLEACYLGQQACGRRCLGQHDFARAKYGDLVRERLETVGPAVLGGREFSGGQVEQRRTEDSIAGDDRHQKGRFPRLEIAGVGERAGRDHAHDLALDQSLCLLRILHLLADGHAEALSHELRQVAVGGMERHAAHRDAVAACVLRARRQREIEGASRHERILVEHLVEVAHPEEHDRVAILALGILGTGASPE